MISLYTQYRNKEIRLYYKNNTNIKWDESMIFKKDDMVIVSFKNIKTNQPKRKWDNNWDRL